MSPNPFEELMRELQALRAEVRELRAVVGEKKSEPGREVLYPTINAYAVSRGYSRRFVFTCKKEGLPTIGAGRGVRVDAAAADEWLRRRTSKPSIEEVARAVARKASR